MRLQLRNQPFLAGIAVSTFFGCSGSGVVDTPVADDNVPTRLIAPVTDPTGPRLVPFEQMRIDGASESTSWGYLLVAVSEEGHTYVVDQQSKEVQVFDTLGVLTTRFGGAGGGPGELSGPTGLSVAGDTLFVLDRRGVNLFGTDGSFYGRVAIEGVVREDGGVSIPQSIDHTPFGIVTSFDIRGVTENGVLQNSVQLRFADLETGQTRSPMFTAPDNTLYPHILPGVYGYAWGRQYLTFSVSKDGWLFTPNPDGIDMDIVSLESGVRSRLRWSVTRKRVRRRDVSAAIQEVERQWGSWPSGIPIDREQYLAGLHQLPRSKYRQVVGRILADGDGRLLVERPDMAPRLPAIHRYPTVWDLVTREGHLLGIVEFPARFTPTVLIGNQVTGVVTDSLDVPSVVRYILQESESGMVE